MARAWRSPAPSTARSIEQTWTRPGERMVVRAPSRGLKPREVEPRRPPPPRCPSRGPCRKASGRRTAAFQPADVRATMSDPVVVLPGGAVRRLAEDLGVAAHDPARASTLPCSRLTIEAKSSAYSTQLPSRSTLSNVRRVRWERPNCNALDVAWSAKATESSVVAGAAARARASRSLPSDGSRRATRGSDDVRSPEGEQRLGGGVARENQGPPEPPRRRPQCAIAVKSPGNNARLACAIPLSRPPAEDGEQRAAKLRVELAGPRCDGFHDLAGVGGRRARRDGAGGPGGRRGRRGRRGRDGRDRRRGRRLRRRRRHRRPRNHGRDVDADDVAGDPLLLHGAMVWRAARVAVRLAAAVALASTVLGPVVLGAVIPKSFRTALALLPYCAMIGADRARRRWC